MAPGRVNLIGDHTDYNGGLALPIALDAHAAVVLGAGKPGRLEIIALDLNERHACEFSSRSILAEPAPAWFRYPAGGALLGLEGLGKDPLDFGLRVAFTSTVPVGSGLSSSAAIEVATITGIESHAGRAFAPRTKAALCQRTEHEFAHTPSGMLDPLASIMGATDTGVLIEFDPLRCTPVPIPAGVRLVILDSGETHSNSDGQYAGVRGLCEDAAKGLGVRLLSAMNPLQFEERGGSLSPNQRKAAAHVLGENDRVRDFVRHLGEGGLVEAGRIMNESHRSMSEQLGVSTTGIDRLQAAVSEIDGVLGNRLTGGGFGGFLVAMLESDGAEVALSNIRNVATGMLDRPASARLVRPSAGAHPVDL